MINNNKKEIKISEIKNKKIKVIIKQKLKEMTKLIKNSENVSFHRTCFLLWKMIS